MTDMSDPVVSEIVTARVNLLFNAPFFGNLATRLKLVDATKWCPTMATDGRCLYYNREFIKSLTRSQLIFMVGHEVLHCVYDHLGRRQNRDASLWSMANDYITNYTLQKEKIGEMPSGGLIDDKYTDELTSEEVYKILESKSTKVQMPLDMHLELGDDNGDGSGQGGDGKTITINVVGEDGPPSLSEADLEKIRNEVKAAVINAAQNSAGKIPAGVKRMIDELTDPKMNWKQLLEMHIQSSIKDDYTFMKFSKKTWALGGKVLLPGQNLLNTIDVAIAIDCSGSISDQMLRDFLSEIKGIMEMFRDFKLRIWCFDTQVYSYEEFTPENLDEIYEYNISGGGGTEFMCNWDFMKEEDIEPVRFVMFTDGYPCDSWGDEAYCDTLFIIHGNDRIEAPFGMTAYYDEDA